MWERKKGSAPVCPCSCSQGRTQSGGFQKGCSAVPVPHRRVAVFSLLRLQLRFSPSPAAGWLQKTPSSAFPVSGVLSRAWCGVVFTDLDGNSVSKVSPRCFISFYFDLISRDHFSCSNMTSVQSFEHSLWFGELWCIYCSYQYYSYNRFKLLRYCVNVFWPGGEISICHFKSAAIVLMWNVWRLALQ